MHSISILHISINIKNIIKQNIAKRVHTHLFIGGKKREVDKKLNILRYEGEFAYEY